MGVFAGLKQSDQPAGCPLNSLFIKTSQTVFSLIKPASFSQVSDQRTGPNIYLDLIPNLRAATGSQKLGGQYIIFSEHVKTATLLVLEVALDRLFFY